MTDHDFEPTISAAWDGEPVDLDTLRAALKTAEGREALASYVLIRATAVASDIEPPAEFASRLRASVVEHRRWWLVAGPTIPARLAASLAALAIAGMMWLGVDWRPRTSVSPAAGPAAGATNATATGRVPSNANEQPGGRPTAAGGEQGRVSEPPAGVQPPPHANVLNEVPPIPTRTVRLVPVDSSL